MLFMHLLQRQVQYNRRAAVEYAYRHWNDPNPEFANFDTFGAGGDCSNFTSQCLLAGGWPMDYRRNTYDAAWWYRRVGVDPFDADANDWWSCSWALANLQFLYMQANGGEVLNLTRSPSLARRLRIGDIVYYDWDGDGVFTHSAIVTSHSSRGIPRVTYRTLAPTRPMRNVDYRLRFRGRSTRIFAIRIPSEPVDYGVAPDWNRLRPCDQTRG